MPKAKPKVPKTEKMWMAWGSSMGFRPMEWDYHKQAGDMVKVRIVPEAEYQRLIAATKRKTKET